VAMAAYRPRLIEYTVQFITMSHHCSSSETNIALISAFGLQRPIPPAAGVNIALK